MGRPHSGAWTQHRCKIRVLNLEKRHRLLDGFCRVLTLTAWGLKSLVLGSHVLSSWLNNNETRKQNPSMETIVMSPRGGVRLAVQLKMCCGQ